MNPISETLSRLSGDRIRKTQERLLAAHFSPYVASVELDGVHASLTIDRRVEVHRIAEFDGKADHIADMVRETRADDVFWDVGSYLGLVAVFAGRRAARGKVVAIEPEPDCAKRLRDNLLRNGLESAEVIQCGVGDVEGTLPLNTEGEEGNMASFSSIDLPNRVNVEVHMLDRLVGQRREAPPTILNIDVPGWEVRVLRGAHETLRSPALRSVFIEVHPTMLIRAGESFSELFGLLELAGFHAMSCVAREQELHFRFGRRQ